MERVGEQEEFLLCSSRFTLLHILQHTTAVYNKGESMSFSLGAEGSVPISSTFHLTRWLFVWGIDNFYL